ncbi:hypothetical protein PQU94_04075 [Asticcacaulis sp. DXS10W]|uniref:Polymerase nucleotidyl transferase domain-containing protein n=1 Tax=Asticcacaulis currens TaxID=2984210 RepID=A0ABT5IB86_9CAUL|nr:hypothetical protein [Asticcacaulis currens]MDC7693457.1 hypothetical protein [Asticcacaulis currens]
MPHDLPALLRKGFPPYIEAERASSPMNSSPYRISRSDLFGAFCDDTVRIFLLETFEKFAGRLEADGFDIPGALIGGGFVRRLGTQTQPKDIDALVFYRVKEGAPEDAINQLVSRNREARELRLDIRFCPLDADPFTMIKSVSFFSVLYSKKEGDLTIRNGLILYDRQRD